jgi:hypothetical protein
MNGVKDGVPNAPPYPPHPVDGVQTDPTPVPVHVDENPPMKFVFQAKVEANRFRNEKFPFQLKSLLIELIVQHQRVDPTFHLLPTEDGSTAGAITKASDLPNTEQRMKEYVKEMHEIDSRNSSHYTVVFFIKVASSKTLAMMKQDKCLFDWLRDRKLFIRAFFFTTMYDVVNAGFISQMHGGIHNRDKMNNIIQAAMKSMFPEIEVKMFPTAFRHGPKENKCTTQVVSIQADRKQLNEAREALVHVFLHSADKLPNDIFFVPPAPTNGLMSYEMYYDLVNAHAASTSNIRSFALTGIANLKAKINIQSTTDPNSCTNTTIEDIIMGANAIGTDIKLFSSIEPTSKSQSEGRFLLLTKKHHSGQAEKAIDDLIEFISNNPPDIKSETNLEGMEITRANKYNGSNTLNGHLSFLSNQCTTNVGQNYQNAWNKRRAQPTAEYYQPDKFPALPNAKAARHETSENPSSINMTDDNEMSDTILVDFDTEMAKERERSNSQMQDMKRELYAEINKMKENIEKSEKRMMDMMKDNLGEMIRSNAKLRNYLDIKQTQRADEMFKLVASIQQTLNSDNRPTSPPRKQPRTHDDATPMEDVTLLPTNNPASPQNLFPNGKDARASENS